MVEGNAMKGYICPSCLLLISASSEILGVDVVCPGCRSRIRIPSLDESVAPVEPVVQTMGSYLHVHQNVSTYSWRVDLPVEILASQSKGLPWAMLLPAFAVGAGLLVSLIALLLFTNTLPVEAVHVADVDQVANQIQVSKVASAPSSEEVKELLTGLSQSKNVEELTEFLREVPDLPAKLANYYKVNEVSSVSPVRVLGIDEVRNEPGFYLFGALFDEGIKKAGIVVRNPSGEWVVDWESYVGYCDVAWGELPKLQPKQPSLVRAIRVKNEYYNQGFNSDEWQSFELSNLNSDSNLIGYVRRDNFAIHQLLPIGNQSGAMNVTLKIHFPENVSDPRLVIIDEVVSGNWLTTNSK